MATITRDGEAIILTLTRVEQLGVLRREIRIPLAAVVRADISDGPFTAIRGIRAPGVGFPGVIAAGTWRYRGGKDLVLAHRQHRGAVVLTVAGQPFSRVIVSTDDPSGVMRLLERDGAHG